MENVREMDKDKLTALIWACQARLEFLASWFAGHPDGLRVEDIVEAMICLQRFGAALTEKAKRESDYLPMD